jgi:hypothetical protein
MENLSKVPKELIQASYDIKGSTHSREVLKGQEPLAFKKVTLKDLDFKKIEK